MLHLNAGTPRYHAGYLDTPSAVANSCSRLEVRSPLPTPQTMNDVSSRHSSKDRPQVRPIVDALFESGFSVFWDQQVPLGTDWDSHIRANLAAAKCVIVVWTVNSIASDNVRHEAMLAKQQNKLIPILLGVRPEDLPMGFYTIQTVDLATWTGKADDPTLVKLATEIAARTVECYLLQNTTALRFGNVFHVIAGRHSARPRCPPMSRASLNVGTKVRARRMKCVRRARRAKVKEQLGHLSLGR